MKEVVTMRIISGKYKGKNIEGYDIEVTEDEIYITERVNNILFVKV